MSRLLNQRQNVFVQHLFIQVFYSPKGERYSQSSLYLCHSTLFINTNPTTLSSFPTPQPVLPSTSDSYSSPTLSFKTPSLLSLTSLSLPLGRPVQKPHRSTDYVSLNSFYCKKEKMITKSELIGSITTFVICVIVSVRTYSLRRRPRSTTS